VLDNLVTARGRACDVLEILPHQTVTTARVSGVRDLHLLTAVASRVACIPAKEIVFLTLVAIDIFGPHQSEEVIHVQQVIGVIENMA